MEVKKPTGDLIALQKLPAFLMLFFVFIFFASAVFPFGLFRNNILDVSSFCMGISVLCCTICFLVIFINAMIHAATEHIIYSIVTGKISDVKEKNNKKDELPTPRGM